jgi:tungstate transport system substrate-binding protein
MNRISGLLASLLLLAAGAVTAADDQFIVVASTTSTENSGLFGHLLPPFTAATGIEVRIIAVGTGQAIRLATNGDADVLLVHHPESERQFVAEGHGVERFPVMYNDFVLVGPASDPAGIRDLRDAPEALTRIAAAKTAFASRADDSGTHRVELELWAAAGVAPGGSWYRETGSGMGATLNVASGMNAYALTDRGTWLNFGNRGQLEILVEGDDRLKNPYGVILVNPARHPHVRAAAGQRFIDWLISAEGQARIADYLIGGEQAFFPEAAPRGAE